MRLRVRAGVVWLLAVAAAAAGLQAGCQSGGGTQAEGPPPVQIVGSNWECVSLYGESPLPDQPLTLAFGADGRVSGHTGVNRFSGPYQWSAGRGAMGPVAFGDLAMTKMAGSEPLMKQETRYLEALQAADAMRAEGGLMELAGGGRPLARFRQVRATPGGQ